MIATPCQRNRFMQKLRAKTWIRRKNGIYARAERTKWVEGKRRNFCLGTPSPPPWDLSR